MTPPGLGLFCKYPEAGSVKTRLAAAVGHETALDIYHSLVMHTLKVAETSPCRPTVFFDPPDRAADIVAWLNRDWPCIPQGEGNLGQRMARAIEYLVEEGHPQQLLIGSDCPGLTPDHLEQASKALETADLVLGPALDGGYYLIGMRRLHSSVFENVPWSTEQVLTITLAQAEQQGLSVQLLDALADVDRLNDWNQTREFLDFTPFRGV